MEAAFKTVFSAIDGVPYDVVHNHAFDAPAIRLAARLSPPVIHTLHLPPDVAVRSALTDVLRSSRPPTVAAVSASHARDWGFTTVLPDGIPVASIPWSSTPGAGVLFAGRFSPEKGGAEAIEIAQRAGVAIEVYGDPYDPVYAENEIEARRRLPGVTIHASRPRNQLWQVMTKAAAVLCPIRWNEPFGLVAAEAQAAGTPVIAFKCGAMEEVVLDGQTGFLISPGDLDAAAQAFGRIDLIDRQACRRHAEQHLSLERSLDSHERLYASIIDSRAQAHG